MTDLIEREAALAAVHEADSLELAMHGEAVISERIASLPAADLDQITYLRGWNDAMKSIKARVIDDPALSPKPVDASQTSDPVVNDPRVKALREAADKFSSLAILRKMWTAAEVENVILALIDAPAPDHSAGGGNMIEKPDNPTR